jgi:predicted transcriptional regulator of viral defense system
MKSLDIINKIAQRSQVFTFDEFAASRKGSATSAANALRVLADMGIIDRVSRGAYVIRPIGRLGTNAAAEDIALVVGARFSGSLHRIAYAAALSFHGLLTRPTNKIQVATPRYVDMTELGERPFQSVAESSTTIDTGALDAGHGARVSGVERSLIDGARRIDLVGGVSTIADALLRLGPGEYDPDVIVRCSSQLGIPGALRRLGSIARAVGQDTLAGIAFQARRHRHLIPVDPHALGEPIWVDPDFKVAWAQEPLDELGLDRAPR